MAEDDADDPIKQLANTVANSAPRPKVTKANHMLSLREPQFSRFREYCRAKGIKPSNIVDSLIDVFMQEAESDIRATLGDGDAPRAEGARDDRPSPRRGGR